MNGRTRLAYLTALFLGALFAWGVSGMDGGIPLAVVGGPLVTVALGMILRAVLDPTWVPLSQEPLEEDGSGERPVWTSGEVRDRLSQYTAWRTGHADFLEQVLDDPTGDRYVGRRRRNAGAR